MIRFAKKNDAKEIVYINIMGWKNTYKNIFPQEFLDNLNPDDELNIDKCKNKIDEYIVCEIDKKIVGMARYGDNKKGYDSSYGEIYAIYVDSNYEGKGIGTEIVNFILKNVKNRYKHILISTLEQNSANEFYKKIGGKFIGKSEFELNKDIYMENIYKYDI